MRLRKCAITVLLALPFFFSTGLVFAGQQYNPLEDRWETAPDRYQLQYNPLEDEWSYEAPRADLEYNTFENRWDWNPEPSLIQPYPCEVEYDLYHHGESY
ncbi:MAG: hypothetical protein OES18_23245 [Deltaproteobacteria bacterium]|nr:hypothetical protein [Deltaproteobacteria bacterium]